MLPLSVARAVSRASACLLVLLLASCGGGDGGDSARPPISPTRTPTATLPSLEGPSTTRSPDQPGSPELPSLTRSAGQTENPEEPAPRPSTELTEGVPATETSAATTQATDEPAEAPVDAPVQDATDDAATDDEGVPAWAWWLLAAVAVASGVAIPLAMRARHRRAWRQALSTEEGELAWFARELLPSVRQAGSREMVAGGWAVGQPRVAATEDRLTALESTAPDEAGRQRARSLRDATRQARLHMDRLTAPQPPENWALDLDEIIVAVEAALRLSPVTSPV